MTDLPGGDGAAAAIHARFAKPVRYTGAGLVNQSVAAVRTHRAGRSFDLGNTIRELWFELRKADVVLEPANGDLLVENDGAGARRVVIEVTDRDEVDAWLVKVEAE